ncbi:MAG: hypothetical protein IMW94_01475 [Thermoanaerobacter sp.]|nr:hypothetical protein [Thermoanaerobacter sp.]
MDNERFQGLVLERLDRLEEMVADVPERLNRLETRVGALELQFENFSRAQNIILQQLGLLLRQNDVILDMLARDRRDIDRLAASAGMR